MIQMHEALLSDYASESKKFKRIHKKTTLFFQDKNKRNHFEALSNAKPETTAYF